jgi:hypothetical protein
MEQPTLHMIFKTLAAVFYPQSSTASSVTVLTTTVFQKANILCTYIHYQSTISEQSKLKEPQHQHIQETLHIREPTCLKISCHKVMATTELLM